MEIQSLPTDVNKILDLILVVLIVHMLAEWIFEWMMTGWLVGQRDGRNLSVSEIQ